MRRTGPSGVPACAVHYGAGAVGWSLVRMAPALMRNSAPSHPKNKDSGRGGKRTCPTVQPSAPQPNQTHRCLFSSPRRGGGDILPRLAKDETPRSATSKEIAELLLRCEMRTAAAALLLRFLPSLLLLRAAAAGNGSCERRCGSFTVQYPFGFSSGCKIPLGCDHLNGTAWLGTERELGLIVSNVTARALFLTLLPNCSRRLNASVNELFTDNYAPGPQNALVVSSCNDHTARVNNCSVSPASYLNSSSHRDESHCFHGAKVENFSCVVQPPQAPSGNGFLNRTEMKALGSECSGLVSAVRFYDAPTPALLLDTMELEWWMLGSCRCSRQANCTQVTTPTAGQGFRCECPEGFEGDGFVDGTGCRRVSCNPSKYLAGDCGKTIQIILLVAGIVFGAMVTGATCLVYQVLKRRSASIRSRRSTKRLLSEASCCAVPFYSYREIDRATDSFSDANRLGTGAYGTVYAGRLGDGRLVAVKRIRPRDNAGLDCVMNEVKLVSCVCHRNLVRLLGCCIEQGQQILVYEFMPNGTLAQHLQRERGPAAMPWTVRLRIAAETAKAIAYLHTEVHPPIFHRDIKSSNILLDHEYNSKVADFGLSRLGKASSVEEGSSHISTAPQGTPGYVDPQYHQNFHLSDRSDVYSFGVVLVEIITAMKAVDLTRPSSEVNLAQLAVEKIGRGRVDDIVDPCLDPHRDAWTLSSIHKVAELAFRCLAFHSEMRPSMAEVADELEQIQRSGWAPSADDAAAFLSTSSSICSSVASTRGTDRSSWGAGRSRTERAAANALVAEETAAPKGAAESPVSVQERWFSDRSSPSSNSLLGNRSVH